jgi:hypothetical protein
LWTRESWRAESPGSRPYKLVAQSGRHQLAMQNTATEEFQLRAADSASGFPVWSDINGKRKNIREEVEINLGTCIQGKL